MAPSSQVRLNVRRHGDESVAQKYKGELAGDSGELDYSDDPQKLWTDLTQIVKISESCLPGTRGTSKSFLTKDNTENNRGELQC